MSRLLKIASIQREGVPANAKTNVDELEFYIDVAHHSAPWLDLIVFPEIAVQGLAAEIKDIAEPINGDSVKRLTKKAKEVKKWIIPGSMFEKDGDKVYNTMPIISPEGEVVDKYRKMFPYAPAETSVPGNRFVVVDIPNIGKLGVCICLDGWFPETARTLVSMGAEVIYHPSFTPSFLTEQERICRMSMALYNQAYVIGTSACGFHGGFTLTGHAMIVDPEGVVLQESGDTPSMQLEVLDLDKVTRVRKYGTKGSAPFLKYLNYYKHKFPVYGNEQASSPYLNGFGSVYDVIETLE